MSTNIWHYQTKSTNLWPIAQTLVWLEFRRNQHLVQVYSAFYLERLLIIYSR